MIQPDVGSFAAKFKNTPRNAVRLRRALVVATAANTVDLRMDADTGITHNNVEYFGALPPKNGESVWVLVIGAEVICLGSTADSGGDLPVVQLTRSASQTTGLTTSGYVDLVWDAEYGAGDPWNMHALSPGSADIIAPMRGIYTVSTTVTISANSGGTYRGVRILVDGNIRASQQIVHPVGTVGSALNTIITTSWIGRAQAGDVVKVTFGHDAGINLQAVLAGGGPHFTMAYIGSCI